MYFSKYNIVSKFKDSEDFFIVNMLSGNADVLEKEMAADLLKGVFNDREALESRGYLIDEQDEAKHFRVKYLDFIDERENDEVQLFFVPSYACNFDCSYCYQSEYVPEKTSLTQEVTDAFFNYVDQTFANRKKYITLFGGEPLLFGESHKRSITYFLEMAKKRQLDVAIVTNGYNLSDYLPLLQQYSIREIQVTVDGTSDTHNKRRYLKGGGATFDKIVEGVSQCLKRNIPVNMRFVADKENIDSLVGLSRFAIQQGWTNSPLFKTQIGRNYELHSCQSNNDRLFTRLELSEKLYQLCNENPEILAFHKPAFSISRYLAENGELPTPLFDSCPGCKTEWAFDYTGKIYSCTATVGKQDEELGEFWPNVFLKSNIVEGWEERDVTTISECKDCAVQLACGGGCASVAKNNKGSLCKPDCRPVKDLLELGFSFYHNDFEN